MGIFFNKKKKEKKPWNRARLVKLFMPLLIIGIVGYSIYNSSMGCSEVFGTYNGIVKELSKSPKDVRLCLF